MWEKISHSWFVVPAAPKLSMKCRFVQWRDPNFSLVRFVFRKSIKKLVLKNLSSSSLFSPVNRENEDLASPSEYPENGDRYGDE